MARSGRIAIRPTAQLCRLPGKAAERAARRGKCENHRGEDSTVFKSKEMNVAVDKCSDTKESSGEVDVRPLQWVANSTALPEGA
eukprot:5751580-Heterocapsa_arctica.AAC.1